ncbi:SurA N-terminal domain-containing protein [Candidatus Woesearchaeota archaeon]|nr:SurA N-terminal domain-containing protein [Candidatus Woesearchaeota archaeon]
MGNEQGKAVSASAVILFAVVAVALIAFIGGCSSDKVNPEWKGREVAALVDGANIYFDDVNDEYAALTPEQRLNITKSDALSFVIEREVLYQAALKEKLAATDEEVNQEYSYFLLTANLTEAQLKENLVARNSSLEKLKVALKKQVLISKLLDKKVPVQFIVKREEAEAAYNSSRFPSLGIPFEKVEKNIVDSITASRQREQRAAYIEFLKDQADVLIVAVPS